jgi:hypothetical protein
MASGGSDSVVGGEARAPGRQLPTGTVLLQLRWSVAAHEDGEFNRWYDQEHFADVVGVPGVVGGRRFRRHAVAYSAATDFNYVTLYEVEAADVLDSAPYRRLGAEPSEWTRRVAFSLAMARTVYARIAADGSRVDDAARVSEVPAGRAVLHVMTDVDASILDDFHAWYAEEHLPLVTSVPGVLAGRRFVTADGVPAMPEGLRFLALYELADVGVATSAELEAISAPTAWRQRIGDALRSHTQVYEHVYP